MHETDELNALTVSSHLNRMYIMCVGGGDFLRNQNEMGCSQRQTSGGGFINDPLKEPYAAYCPNKAKLLPLHTVHLG